jgi:uncharacterized OB-fold protein
MLPRITEDKRPFWEALKEHRFITTRCKKCATVSFPPRLLCPACLGDEREWIELSGRGRIYAFTHNRIVPRNLIREAPYITAMVDLEEGPRILTRIENAGFEELDIGRAVRIGFKPLAKDITFFFFEPA